jgi:hypothetical protein
MRTIKSCVRVDESDDLLDWILLVKGAKTLVNSLSNFNQLSVDES